MPVQIVITPILPKGDYLTGDFAKFERLTLAYLRGPLNTQLKRDMDETTKNWSGKPRFRGTTSTDGRSLILHVRPYASRNADKWARLDAGVQGRVIHVRRAPALTIQSYTPHTRPKGRWGGPGKRHGEVTYAQSAQWPGIQAREFSKVIAKRREREIVYKIHEIVRKAFF